jgi:hypothetical protein
VATVSVEDPTLFANEIVPSEHVAAGLVTGVTLQLSATLDGLRPPVGLMVMVEVDGVPGATEAGDSAEAESPKPGAATIRLIPVDVLTL